MLAPGALLTGSLAPFPPTGGLMYNGGPETLSMMEQWGGRACEPISTLKMYTGEKLILTVFIQRDTGLVCCSVSPTLTDTEGATRSFPAQLPEMQSMCFSGVQKVLTELMIKEQTDNWHGKIKGMSWGVEVGKNILLSLSDCSGLTHGGGNDFNFLAPWVLNFSVLLWAC